MAFFVNGDRRDFDFVGNREAQKIIKKKKKKMTGLSIIQKAAKIFKLNIIMHSFTRAVLLLVEISVYYESQKAEREIGHSRVASNLCLKARLIVKPLMFALSLLESESFGTRRWLFDKSHNRFKIVLFL